MKQLNSLPFLRLLNSTAWPPPGTMFCPRTNNARAALKKCAARSLRQNFLIESPIYSLSDEAGNISRLSEPGRLRLQSQSPLGKRGLPSSSSQFIDDTRNIVLVGGTGKTYLAVAIAAHAVRQRYKVRYFNVVDLINQLEQEQRTGHSGRLTERLKRHIQLIVLDEL